mgnify:CR=1 FL=1
MSKNLERVMKVLLVGVEKMLYFSNSKALLYLKQLKSIRNSLQKNRMR